MKDLLTIRWSKELLLSAVILTLVLGPFQPLVAQAQDEAGMSTLNATTPQQVIDTSNTVNSQNQARTTSTAGANQTAAAGTGSTNTGGGGNPFSDSSGCSQGVAACLSNVVYVFTVGIGSGFAYVAAYFFDLAVNLSLNGPAYALTFISTGWTTARDLANMAFLFILIYIAFTIMLEADTHGTMSLLAGVIVIALLVNFSFFFTRVVIDAGNILSIQFYNSITAPSVQSTAQNSNVASAVGAAASIVGASNQSKDLTASIMGMLQLQNLFNTTSFQQFNKENGFLVVLVTLSFLYIAAGIMFYLITVMFVTVGVKFLMRIVVLWFLIIASPLAFVSRAMPKGNKLRGYFDQWRDLLISHAFYPVAFMFIFLILTNFTNQMGNCNGITSGGTSSQSCLINDIFTALPGANSNMPFMAVLGLAIANVAIRMGFVIAILYLGMKASDSISVMGSKFAESAGSWMGSKYIGFTGGAARNTLGFGAYKLGQTNALQTWSRKDPIIGRTLFNVSNRLGKSNFDARTPLGALGVKAPGKAQKDGYKGQVDARIKRREKEAEQYSNDISQEQKDKAKKEQEEANNKYQKDLAAAREKDDAAQSSENLRAQRAAEDQVDPTKNREVLATNITNTAKIQQDLMKAQAEAAKNVDTAKQKIQDLRDQNKEGTPEMAAAIAERDTHQTNVRNFDTLKTDADTKLKVYTEEQKKINEEIAKRAKELAVKVEATKVEAKQIVEAPISQRKGFANALESRKGNASRFFIYVPAADKKAADKIRKGKTKAEKLAEAAKEYEEEKHKEEHGDEDKAHAGETKATSAKPEAAARGGGDSHGPAPH